MAKHRHSWESPYELVKGCIENPGVFNRGDRWDFHYVCSRCGAKLHTWEDARSEGRKITGPTTETLKWAKAEAI